MKALFVPLLVMSVLAVKAEGQEPRLPAPVETPSPDEALIQRARALYASRNYRESAATWQTVAVRQPSVATLAQRESVRALIAAGDLEPALAGMAEMGAAAPAELLLRAADAHRSAKAFDRAVTFIVALARRLVARRQPTRRHSGWPPRSKKADGLTPSARDVPGASADVSAGIGVRCGRRWCQTPFGPAQRRRAFDRSGLRRHRRSPRRRRGVSARRRHADRMAREVSRLAAGVNVESAMVQNLYLVARQR